MYVQHGLNVWIECIQDGVGQRFRGRRQRALGTYPVGGYVETGDQCIVIGPQPFDGAGLRAADQETVLPCFQPLADVAVAYTAIAVGGLADQSELPESLPGGGQRRGR